MIRVEHLTKQYGDKLAISDVTFEVKEGEILGFLGPNGAGKTTAMRILAGYMPASSGTASVAGFDVFSQSLEARRRVGYLPENVPLYPEMTVESYLTYMAALKGVAAKGRRDRVRDVAARCRVDDVLNRRLGKLSKGYRQRVGLAQAIIHDPKVLILDEPTVGLDPKQITQSRDLIKSLGGSHTIILSTHILPEVSMTCSRVLIINDGKLIASDTPDNLTHRMQGSDRIQLEVRGPAREVAARLAAVPKVVHVESASPGAAEGAAQRFMVEYASGAEVREELARAVVGSGWGLLELRPLTMSLEEVFLKLITKEPAEGEPAEAVMAPSAGRGKSGERKPRRGGGGAQSSGSAASTEEVSV